MQLVKNEQFWDKPSIIETQQVETPVLYWYEKYLLTFLKSKIPQAKLIYVIGCGPGRELPLICESFPHAKIMASDISLNMINECQKNIIRWACETNIKLEHVAASDIVPKDGLADAVIILNNVLTYVTPQKERERTLRSVRRLLKDDGFVISSVHNCQGKLTKSVFFFMQKILKLIGVYSGNLGDRIGGFSGFKTQLHYHTKAEVKELLMQSDLQPIEILSLSELSKKRKHTKRYKGDNNLIFIAKAY